MDILKGRGDRLYFREGDLVLDFSDIVGGISGFLEEQLGVEDVNLFPQAGGGRLVLMSSYQVAVLQEVVSYLTAIGLLLPLLTIVAFGAAVWASLWPSFRGASSALTGSCLGWVCLPTWQPTLAGTVSESVYPTGK
jgi:hypothetical protein